MPGTQQDRAKTESKEHNMHTSNLHGELHGTASGNSTDGTLARSVPAKGGDPRIEQLLNATSDLWRGSSSRQLTGSAGKHAVQAAGCAVDLFAGLDDAPSQTRPINGSPSGYAALDALLPWGGWPQSGLVEVISRHKGIGELQLLMPLLKQRSHLPQSVLWIAPPYPLHGPALAQAGVNIRNSFVIPSETSCNKALWSIEKALQSSECALVLAWQNWLSPRVVRRLQLAAREGQTLGVLFHQRPTPNSPAVLQLQLSSVPVNSATQRSLDVELLKASGSHKRGRTRIQLPC
jgi:hypothetical protein